MGLLDNLKFNWLKRLLIAPFLVRVFVIEQHLFECKCNGGDCLKGLLLLLVITTLVGHISDL